MRFNKTFQNPRQYLSENKMRRLFVAKEGEAFSYTDSITKFCLSYSELLSCLTLPQRVTLNKHLP